MVTIGVFPFQGKTHMVEPAIVHGTSWLVVRNSDHHTTRLVEIVKYCKDDFFRPLNGYLQTPMFYRNVNLILVIIVCATELGFQS